MSGFYDDGGVTFAKEQFDNVRKRKEKEAKRQDKAAQKLLLTDLAVKGFNMSLNNKYEKLAQEALFEKSAYFQAIEDSKTFLNFYNEEKAKGFSDEQIYRNNILGEYQKYIGEGYVVDGIEGLVDDFVSSGNNFQNYKNMIEHHKKVAGINPEELKAYIKTGVTAPRNLGELIGNKIKKISMSHTDETLKDKDTKIRNQEINKIDLLGFGVLRDSLEEYNGVSSITALRKAIEENPDKYRPYKMLGEGTYIEDSKKDGMVVPSMVFTRKFKGSGDEAYAFNQVFLPDSLGQRIEDTRDKDRIEYDIETTSYRVFDIIKNSTFADNLSPGIQEFYAIMEDPKDKEYDLNAYRTSMTDIGDGANHILKKHSNIVKDENLAIEIAAINLHINKEAGIPVTKRPNLYAVETILAEKTNQEPDLSNLQNWIDDLKDTNNYTKGESHRLRIQMLEELPYYIKDESEKEDINKILSQNNLPSLDDIQGDIEENYIDNWKNLNQTEQREYKNNRDSVFKEIKNELKDEINFGYSGGVLNIIKEDNTFNNTILTNYFNNLTSDEQQKYGGVFPEKGGINVTNEEKEAYKNLVLDFKEFFMSKVEDLNISEGDFDASFYINNYKILQ